MKPPFICSLAIVIPFFMNCTPLRSQGLKVSSNAFENNGLIPSKFTCDSVNVSPQIKWSAGPEGTKTYALICDDPDAPSRVWVHWLIFNIPETTLEIPENAAALAGASFGTNDFRRTAWGGPCPPSGTHHYHFKIYALDGVLPLSEGASKSDIVKAMEGHILASGELVGLYARKAGR